MDSIVVDIITVRQKKLISLHLKRLNLPKHIYFTFCFNLHLPVSTSSISGKSENGSINLIISSLLKLGGGKTATHMLSSLIRYTRTAHIGLQLWKELVTLVIFTQMLVDIKSNFVTQL